MAATSQQRARAYAWTGALCAPAVFAVCHLLGILGLPLASASDLLADDARIRAIAPDSRDDRIVIVDIDEHSLQSIGRWPWPRDVVARLTGQLFATQGAAVVGFDTVFAEPDATAALARMDAIASGLMRGDEEFQRRWQQIRPTLDNDGILAAELVGRPAVLGFYLAPLHDAARPGGSSDEAASAVAQAPRAAPTELPAPLRLTGRLPDDARLHAWSSFTANLPALAHAAPRGGFINHVADSDGTVRSVPLLALRKTDAGPAQAYPSLGLAMMLALLGDPKVDPVVQRSAGRSVISALRLEQSGRAIQLPLGALGEVHVPFRARGGPTEGAFRYVSAADVLEQRLPANSLAGKLVIIGTSVPTLADLRATPIAQNLPGVEVHAHLVSGLLDGRFVIEPEWAPAWGAGLTASLCAAALLLLRRARSLWRPACALALLLGATLALDRWLLLRHGWLLPIATPLGAALATGTLGLVRGWWTEGRSRRALQALFGTYVPPQIVRRMAGAPEDFRRAGLGAENRELTVLFCDLRNFTRSAQSLPPEQVRELVNLFFSGMTRVIHDHGGTVDKFIGDAIMAFWGAPLADPAHAAHALRCALSMQRALDELNEALAARALPPVGLGIGLNTGIVCVGDFGSTMRRSYTVIGDAVNLASRVESLTREYGVDLLLGEATRAAAMAHDDPQAPPLVWCEVDRVRVKGRSDPVRLFTAAASPPEGSGPAVERAREYQLALDAYRRQHWDQAESVLRALLERSTDRDGKQSGWLGGQLPARLLDKIRGSRRHPPRPDWDGVQDYEHK